MTGRIGQQLGNYRLTRLLGRGGFAVVYLGEHIELGTMVAIKILHTRVAEEDLARFRQESRLLANLKHPQIVRVLDFGVDQETPYLVMDYAPNGTLRRRHPKGRPLPVSTVVSYIKQIAQALQYAHDRRIVHRDIKPENMLISENNEILLSDFGVAMIAQSSRDQSTQDVSGTVAYMSPEQIQGKPRPASDQYSLGIVIYEWLAGTLPFEGSFTELCTQHMFAPPPPLHEKVPTISPEVERVIATALAKDPKQRFVSVQAFATALEQASQETLPAKRGHLVSSSSSLYGPPLSGTSTLSPQAQQSVEFSAANRTPPARFTPSPSPVLQTPPPLNRPNLSPPVRTTAKPSVSHRATLIGVVGLVLVVAIFAIITLRPVKISNGGNTIIPPTTTASPGTGPSIAGAPEAQTVPLSALSQLLVCDAAGDISLGIDPNANATSATVTTTKIALNTSDQNDANQKVSQVVVSVQGQLVSPSQQPLACPNSSANTMPGANTAPTATSAATNSSYTGLSVNVSFPPNQANNTAKVNIAILLPQVVVQAQQASTNAVPTLFVQDDVGNINIDAGNMNAIMNIAGLSGDVTVRNAILVDGSHLNAGGKLTFNGFISQIATPPNKQPSLRFDGTSLIDLTLPESSPVIIDATVDTPAGKITSDFPINVVTQSSGYHTYDGPFNPAITTDKNTAPTLHVISSNGNISLHKK